MTPVRRYKAVPCATPGCPHSTPLRDGDTQAHCARCREEVDALWPSEERIENIGPNGNDGLHYKDAPVTAAQILAAAAGHMQDRAATYDKPEGERSMAATVAAFQATTGVALTEEQGWLFMLLLKAVRSQQGAYRADSYEDGAAYFSLAGEAAAKERDRS